VTVSADAEAERKSPVLLPDRPILVLPCCSHAGS
jgi:hypothetical protein